MRNFIFCFILVFFSAAVIAQSTPKGKYFEGVIEYDIQMESFMPGISDNELRERMGAKLRFYFKNGSYIREYLDAAGYTLRKVYYIKDKNMVYDHNVIAIPDTLYLMDPAEEFYVNYKIEPGNEETILNYQCKSSVISAQYYVSVLPDTGRIKLTYYFAKELPVDPDWHKKVHVWKDVIKEHKSIAVKFIEDDPSFLKQTFTATKVLWQSVPDEVFKIDPKLIQVKAPRL